MGRPLKKKLYQDPAAPGPQFDEVDAWIPLSEEILIEISPERVTYPNTAEVTGYSTGDGVGSLSITTWDLPGNPGATFANFLVAVNAGPESGAGIIFSHPGGTLTPSNYTLGVRLGDVQYTFIPNPIVSTTFQTVFGSNDPKDMAEWRRYFESGFGNTLPIYLSEGSGEPEKCYITSQTGTHKFYCVGKDSGFEGVCRLVDKAAGSLLEGEMTLTCTPFGGSPERIRSISTNKVRTFGGDRYKWEAGTLTAAAGEADLDQLVPKVITADFTMTAESSAFPGIAWSGYTLGDNVIGLLNGTIGTINPTTLDIGGNVGAIVTDLVALSLSVVVDFPPTAPTLFISHAGGVEIPEGFWIDMVVGGQVYRMVAEQRNDYFTGDNADYTFFADKTPGASAQLAAYFQSQGSNPFPVQLRYLEPET